MRQMGQMGRGTDAMDHSAAFQSRTLSERRASRLPITMRRNALSASACPASQASPCSTSLAGSAYTGHRP